MDTLWIPPLFRRGVCQGSNGKSPVSVLSEGADGDDDDEEEASGTGKRLDTHRGGHTGSTGLVLRGLMLVLGEESPSRGRRGEDRAEMSQLVCDKLKC